ncbi:MAG: putative signal transducing protein, partial [Phycisphaerae bacterium]
MSEAQFDGQELLDRSGLNEFVPVMFARNLTEAAFYRSLLEQRDIPTAVESEQGEADGAEAMVTGVPILVPDEMLDEASQIVAEGGDQDLDDDLTDDLDQDDLDEQELDQDQQQQDQDYDLDEQSDLQQEQEQQEQDLEDQ